MGLLDELLDSVFDNLSFGGSGRRDRGLERLARDGELAPATIYAIRRVEKADSADEWTYGLDLVTRDGPLRAAVRQHLQPEPWRAPLGARVLARHLGGRVAIDWPATLAEAGVACDLSLLAGKTLRTPLEPGVHDTAVSAKRLRDGIRTEAQLLSSTPVEVMGMATQSRRLELRLDDGGGPRTVVLRSAHVPPYAVALAAVGARLPVAVDRRKPDRVTVDWPAAAEAAAGGR